MGLAIRFALNIPMLLLVMAAYDYYDLGDPLMAAVGYMVGVTIGILVSNAADRRRRRRALNDLVADAQETGTYDR